MSIFDFQLSLSGAQAPAAPSGTHAPAALATCLGCGCTCDDIAVVVRSGRIAEARNACALGVQWFGTGLVPARITSGSTSCDLSHAIAQAAQVLGAAQRPLIYIAGDVSCESQRMGVAIADVLGATLDSITTATAGTGILSAQRRGRVAATLGEIRNRADVVLFWGIDTAARYPRYAARYAPLPAGLYVPLGRSGRRVIAVDIGSDLGPADADTRIAFAPDEEVMALTLARAAATDGDATDIASDSLEGRAAQCWELIRSARYAAIVADGEDSEIRDPKRAEALILLVDAANRSTRCVLGTLRAGGNRSGADAVMTWQTGFPMAVDFMMGTPTYRPDAGAAALLESREIDAAVVLGAPASVPGRVARALTSGVACIAIGPRASESPYPTAVAIDTGVAGIHERGSVVRMDEVTLPLRPALESNAVSGWYERGQTLSDTTTGDALAADGLPQDSLLVLRALATAVARRAQPPHARPNP